MKTIMRFGVAAASVVMLFVLAASAVHAQADVRPEVRAPQQQISANPFGLLLEVFNAEFERAVGETLALGVGGSYWGADDDSYLNGDLFLRFYPQGVPLQGFAFGVKAGITRYDAEENPFEPAVTDSYFGVGFDIGYGWVMGRNDNFYVGVGLGLKRLFGVGEEYLGLEYYPTIRIVNVGFAF
jgi:opacity protein-like surface antigen